MTFRVGQKVVCVSVANITHRPICGSAADHLRVGEVYTIRWIGESPYEGDRHLGLTVKLSEVVRPNEQYPEYNDYPFMASRFRPIVERKTDISFAHEILRKATKPARVPSVAITQHHRGTENG